MEVYADESCTQASDGRFMVIGCLTCDNETAAAMRGEINELNMRISKQSEYHFCKISSVGSAQNYKHLCDIFLNFHNQKCSYKRGLNRLQYYRKVCFDAILIEHSLTDHLKFSDGDSQIGFFRFYKTLLLHVVKKHFFSTSFAVTIDNITLKSPNILEDLRCRVNESMASPTAISKLVKQDSKVDTLLQMADVLTGAVAFAWNRQECDPSPRNQSKLSVVQHIESKLNRPLTRLDTPGRSFNIWQLKM